MLLFANVGNEYGKLWDFWWAGSEQRLPPASVALLCIGAVVGTLIGYSGWWCRSVVSATSFTLIGVVNKCLTILLNVLIWDQHATPGGIFSLFVCISGGLIYQQSPMRGASGKTEETEGSGTASADVETVELMEKEQGQSSAQKRRG
mmetsp:Transcript_36494/g.88443  ORF Transcript_36494/g.88443 Transcript_36494/m.88443 type:complete len:147 (-) Transcript_36494:1610-2050(-)